MRKCPARLYCPVLLIFLKSGDPEKNTRFYRWEFEATYEFALPLAPRIRVEFGNPPFRGNDQIVIISEAESEGYRCWKTGTSQNILIASTDQFVEDAITDYPLHFVDSKSSKLSFRYSLLVKQYAISKAYHQYLHLLVETNETTGGLFDPTPTEFFGNVKNTDGRDIPVLGYFAVAGVSKKRIFIDRSDLPSGFTTPSGPMCEIDTIELDYPTLYSALGNGKKVLFNYYFLDNPPPGEEQGYLLTDPICTSCTLNDATNVKPDFW